MDNAVLLGGRYALGHKLGAGMQAEVRAARDTASNTAVALKLIDKSNIRTKALVALEREVNIMKTLVHPNILALKGFDSDITYDSKPVAVLVLEIADGGELFDYLMYSGYFEEVVARTYMHQLVGALRCCHEHNIFHRDIKPENILLDSHFQLKLADFGLSNITEDTESILETECGTKSYMAPEIFQHAGYQGGAVDVWSAGVVLFIMLCGSPPFDIANRRDWWFNAISMNRYDRFWAAHLRGAGHMRDKRIAQDFVNRIFVPDPNKRLTLEAMDSHEWFCQDTLDHRRLSNMMSDRKRKIEDAKAAERAAARKTNTRGGAVDVFERNTHRSVGAPPPIYDPTSPSANLMTEFYTPVSEEDILVRLTREIVGLDPAAQVEASPGSYSVKATVRLPGESFEMDGEVISTPGAAVNIAANVYQADASSSDVYLVSVHRGGGEPFAFKKLFQALKGKMAPDPEDGAGGEEEEFSEDIGMI
mmetsp:Transcript_20116/g.28917  ORF Transcript_20116/g.28917 Transcript_20116/m.28917 type:complete len:477 (+) Transcript_20116:131-1561(+)|eukprot:CAMPEP_0185024392 /NCGR_PEP_ID=MMETSP1103-20130426/7443_1 /TAXON_ID=36769 /ORGANISM="Paraphysomonas bandaiensis, Strain Caron Lab Isolate" /LENGTH=476 /DNA_ID=CAMNT_0027557343 /DNA_START=99 /DNA_END=1529 /DNA_ORIENTATION=+